MLSIQNDRVALYASPDGKQVFILDKKNGERWDLDPETVIWGSELSENNHPAQDWQNRVHPLVPVGARLEQGALCLKYRARQAEVNMVYRLERDGVEIVLPACPLPVQACALPGAFVPAGGAQKLVLPIMQGVLWKGGGEAVDRLVMSGAHDHFSMQMFGAMGKSGGLLFALESVSDAFFRYAKRPDGRFFAQNIQISSLGEMRYERRAHLFLTEPGITPIAKRYRKFVMEQGRFKSWAEKIEERPALKRLFGSIMCFIGYCQDELDYVAEFKKLRAYGFDRALIYPVRMHSYNLSFQMGGEPPIWLTDEQIQAIKDLGYDVSPWSWINEAMDDGTGQTRGRYRINRAGEPILGWRMDDFVWNKCCSSRMAEYQKEADHQGMAAMTWDHFDVLTCAMIGECYAKDHPGHPGRPLSRAEDIEWLKKTLEYGRNGKKAVSSESFNDIFSLDYDMGSVKAFPSNWKRPFQVIPLTALVYHDSMLHTWWEPHNYNTHYFNRITAAGYLEYGGGRTRLMAASDALMGAVPDVFPFGAQYGWTGRGSETYLYRIRFEDPEVQFALKAAKPVAELHRRIGMLEMTGFEMLSEDGCLQRSVFADGTSVVANFSNFQRGDCADMKPIGAESWMIDERM